MKKTILYAVVAAVAVAVGAIGIVGCGGDYGESSQKMDDFLDKFHYNKRVLPKYTLTYDGNGADSGDVPRGPTMYDSGTTVSILDAGTLIKHGSSFSGWNSKADGRGANYSKDGVGGIKITNDITLYAVWDSGVTYAVTVRSSPVGMSVSGGRRYKPDETVTISAEESSDGWRFQNWTATNNDVSFADAEKAETSFRMPKKDVTVTAVFVADGGKMDLFRDDRDDNVYITVTILEQTWMAQNLNYKTEIGSWCYEDDNTYCVKYGRLYDWNTAETVCPTGWHLPSRDEWDILAKSVGGRQTSGNLWELAGKVLKSTKEGGGTDNYGFSALLGGSRDMDGFFVTAGDIGRWWTATGDAVNAYSKKMCSNRYVGYDDLEEQRVSRKYGYSVRCLKND